MDGGQPQPNQAEPSLIVIPQYDEREPEKPSSVGSNQRHVERARDSLPNEVEESGRARKHQKYPC